jgi:hypothetical protein
VVCKVYNQHRKCPKPGSAASEQLLLLRQTIVPPVIMAFSEIIRFVLLHHRKSEFLKLREYLKLHGVKEQYFGNMIAPPTAALPVRKDEMCWVIRTCSPLLFLHTVSHA